MNKIKILNQIKDTYSDPQMGLKKLKRYKLFSLIGVGVVMYLAFNYDIFNLEMGIGVFVFILAITILISLLACTNSSLQTFDIVTQIIDLEKVDKLIEEENKKNNT